MIRTVSYVEGEEYTTGRTIEETVYDDKGNVIKSFTYNSLDTSSKFYTETEYDETGRTLATYDETGENKTKFGYVDGTSVVREETLANGSKFAYGYDYDDTVTAISQSTKEGEENGTSKSYQYGELTELRSGNNTIQYTYDYKRRVTSIIFKGTGQQVTYEYIDNQPLSGATVDVSVARTVDGNVFVNYRDKRGQLLRVTHNGTIILDYFYNARNQVMGVTGVDASEAETYAYNSATAKLTSYTHGTYTEAYTYDSFGNVTLKTVTLDNETTEYAYAYKTDSTNGLESITINDSVTFKPQTDCLGRNKGKEIYVGENKIAEESIVYRKVGDHATNMPASVYYGDMKNGSYTLNENVKYEYDEMGNIRKVYQNGEFAVRYAYDKIGRLVREDNKLFGKTWLYTYDNNGNILNKRETEFTLKTNVEENAFTKDTYAYNGDRLMSYNDETFTYDLIGNPKTYRGKAATWTMGRRLASYDGHTYTYDGKGRRTGKDGITYTYDSESRLVKQSDGLEFFYDHTGVAGITYGEQTCFYRKDAQGNIVALLDINGNVVVQYGYDAWGNCNKKRYLEKFEK